MTFLIKVTSLLFCLCSFVHGQEYHVDKLFGLGRRFDGIGGLSGGSATSKLLISYPDKERNEILDLLFKPKYGASLQILKVEIGGDAQASDATEASHMHYPWDENYNRGYEWWLMKEAKKRNPAIKLYGLPWDFPGWIGKGSQNPYISVNLLADYICRWVNGAKVHHNLTIDYIGVWNERHCSSDYVLALRQMLDDRGFTNTRIVGGDNVWQLFANIYDNTTVLSSCDVLGSHYPGTLTPKKLIDLGVTLWSSEDYSSFNDDVGGGCWARILNQNYVTGLMTSTIAWNLIDSFFLGLPWDRDSLMTAREPWSGNYIVESPIWISAHTTQLTEIGWHYLPHSHGVGMLQKGGSYVSLVSPDLQHLTIVIETMSRNHSKCIRPALPPYTVQPQRVTFILDTSFRHISYLNVWHTKLMFNGPGKSTFFQQVDPVEVVNGIVSLNVGVDEVYSLTTLDDGYHVQLPPPPASKVFPLPFSDDFESYPLNAEPYMVAPQQGSFEVVDSGDDHGQVMRQMVIDTPVAWCSQTLLYHSSLGLVGSVNWTDVTVEVETRIGSVNESNGIFLGVRIDNGGCKTYQATGLFLFIYPKSGIFMLTSDIHGDNEIIMGRSQEAILPGWNKVTLSAEGQTAKGTCNGVTLFEVAIPKTSPKGYVGLGTDVYGIADFDNLYIYKSQGNKRPYYHEGQSNSLYFSNEEDNL